MKAILIISMLMLIGCGKDKKVSRQTEEATPMCGDKNFAIDGNCLPLTVWTLYSIPTLPTNVVVYMQNRIVVNECLYQRNEGVEIRTNNTIKILSDLWLKENEVLDITVKEVRNINGECVEGYTFFTNPDQPFKYVRKANRYHEFSTHLMN